MKKVRLLLVFLLSLFLVKSIFSQEYPYTNYSIITIKNNVNSNLYNYPVLITINDTQGLILNGYLNPTCTNLIFQQNGRQLPYFVQTCGYISVNTSTGFSNSTILLKDYPSIPATLSPINGSWWYNNTWTGSALNEYVYITLDIKGYVYPVWLEVNTSGPEYAIWVNGKYLYNSNPWNFTYNSQQLANMTDQLFDITNFIVQNGINNILIFATSNTTNNTLTFRIIIPSANVTITQDGVYYLPGTIWVNVSSIPANNYTTLYMLFTYPNISTITNNLSNVFIYGSYPISNTHTSTSTTTDAFFTYQGAYVYAQWVLNPTLYIVNDYSTNTSYFITPYTINNISVSTYNAGCTISGVNIFYYLTTYMPSSMSLRQFVTVSQNASYYIPSYSTVRIGLQTPIFWLDGYILNIIFNRAPGGCGRIYVISGMNALELYGFSSLGNYPLYGIPVSSANYLPSSTITGYFRKYVYPPPSVSINTVLNVSYPISISIQYPQQNSTVVVMPDNPVIQPVVTINSIVPITICNMTLYGGTNVIYDGVCTNSINVTGASPGYYTLLVSASNQYNSTNASVTFYLTFANGTYGFFYVSYPPNVPSTPFYVNVSTTCTGNICAAGKIQLTVPPVCYTPISTVDITQLLPGQVFSTSFIVQCAYSSSPYNFNVNVYQSGNLVYTNNFTLDGPRLSLSYTTTNDTLYVYAYPSGWGQNITLLVTVKQGWVINSTTTQSQFYVNVSDNTQSLIYTSPVLPGQTYTVYANVYYPQLFATYPVQSIFVTIQATQPPTIYSVTSPSTNYNGLPTDICYNVSDQVAVTSVSGYYINGLGQVVYLFNSTYFNQTVYACTPVNLTLGNYSIYVKACDYSGLCSIFPPVSVSIIPYPQYNIIIYPSNVSVFHSSPQVISIYYSHPLEQYTSCTITSNDEMFNMKVTLYNNTNNTITFSLSPGEYNMFIICSSNYTAIAKPIVIIYDTMPPIIEGFNVTNNILYLYLYDNIGLAYAQYNVTVGNTTNTYNVLLSGTSYILQIPLALSSITIEGYVYDISGLSVPFVYSYSLAQPISPQTQDVTKPSTQTNITSTQTNITNVTNFTNITVYQSYQSNYIALLIPTINATVIHKGLQITASVTARYYPVNCTIYPFNTTMLIQTSAPYTTIITQNIVPGTYVVYAICTDSVGDIATSNMVVLNITSQDIYMFGASAFVGTQNGIYSILLLGGVVALLGYLMRSRVLILIGAGLAASLAPLYTGIILGQPVFAAVEVVVILAGLYVLNRYLLYNAFE
ncbi:MAG: hypothetical protein ACP5GJ_02590 [Nanopusillaceae archaeon]